jgi:hypothetical protein
MPQVPSLRHSRLGVDYDLDPDRRTHFPELTGRGSRHRRWYHWTENGYCIVWSRLGSEVTNVKFFKSRRPKQGLKFKLKTKVLFAEKKDKKVVATVEAARVGKQGTVRGFISLFPAGS